MDWLELVKKYEKDIITKTQEICRIKSVKEANLENLEAPFGQGIRDSLDYILELGQKDGFITKNIDNTSGHIEYGSGDESLGILCHVDVVPEGDNWTYPAYGAEIHDGKLYARGSGDDKGPTIAAYYALKMLKDSGFKPSKKIRIIIGTDEESGWAGITNYFKKEEMPTIGFAPDASFPLIYGEKGIMSIDLVGEFGCVDVVSFTAGDAYNVVPDKASVVMTTKKTSEAYLKYLEMNNFKGEIKELPNGNIEMIAYGKRAHAMEPEKGLNAIHILVKYLAHAHGNKLMAFLDEYFSFDTRLKKVRLNYTSEEMGDLTSNLAFLEYKDGKVRIGFNWRYPIGFEKEETLKDLKLIAAAIGFKLKVVSDSLPHYVSKDDDLVKTLHQAYIKYTNDLKSPLITIGGGTYSRAMKKAVAFGMNFPGSPELAHQVDEHINVEDLIKATVIYAEAIYNLTK